MLDYGAKGDLKGPHHVCLRRREEATLPQTRGYYAQLCELLGCSIELPRLSHYLHIEFSDLKAVDPLRPNEMLLLLSIRNRAPIENPPIRHLN